MKNILKIGLAGLFISALVFPFRIAYSQDNVKVRPDSKEKTEMKEGAKEIKSGAKQVGRGVRKTTKGGAHKTKRVAKIIARDTKKKARDVKNDVKK